MGLFLLCCVLRAEGEPERLICTIALRCDVLVVGQKNKPPSCLPLVGLLLFDALNWRLFTKGLSEKHLLMANEQNKCLRDKTMTVPKIKIPRFRSISVTAQNPLSNFILWFHIMDKK